MFVFGFHAFFYFFGDIFKTNRGQNFQMPLVANYKFHYIYYQEICYRFQVGKQKQKYFLKKSRNSHIMFILSLFLFNCFYLPKQQHLQKHLQNLLKSWLILFLILHVLNFFKIYETLETKIEKEILDILKFSFFIIFLYFATIVFSRKQYKFAKILRYILPNYTLLRFVNDFKGSQTEKEKFSKNVGNFQIVSNGFLVTTKVFSKEY